MRWYLRLGIVSAFTLLVSAAAWAEDAVVRRGGLPTLNGTLVSMNDEGLVLRTSTGATHDVSWDRVRDVRTDRSEPRLAERIATAERLWRARTRVERGDLGLAEPLYAQLFTEYRGRTHAMARLVAEDLLRCRIARGAQADAVIPALEVTRLDRAGVVSPRENVMPAVLDSVTGLSPHLAPVWLDRDAVRRLERGLADYSAEDDLVVAALAHLYRQSARRFLGEPALAPSSIVEAAADHPGVEWLRRMLAAQDDDAPTREASCRALLAGLERGSPWQEAWARYVVGTALLRSEDAAERERGVVHLVHVPARFAESAPFLAGMALERAAEARAAVGDDGAAVALRASLGRMFTAHPLTLGQAREDRTP